MSRTWTTQMIWRAAYSFFSHIAIWWYQCHFHIIYLFGAKLIWSIFYHRFWDVFRSISRFSTLFLFLCIPIVCVHQQIKILWYKLIILAILITIFESLYINKKCYQSKDAIDKYFIAKLFYKAFYHLTMNMELKRHLIYADCISKCLCGN